MKYLTIEPSPHGLQNTINAGAITSFHKTFICFSSNPGGRLIFGNIIWQMLFGLEL
jgi:hypothetical protein